MELMGVVPAGRLGQIGKLGELDVPSGQAGFGGPIYLNGGFEHLKQPITINLLPDATPSAPWSMMDDMDWGW